MLTIFVMYSQPGFIIYNKCEIVIKWCVFGLSFYSLSLIVKYFLFLSLIPHFSVQETKLSQRTGPPAVKSPKLPPVNSSSSSWAFLDYAGAVIFGIVVLVAIVLAFCCFFKCIKLAGPVAPV